MPNGSAAEIFASRHAPLRAGETGGPHGASAPVDQHRAGFAVVLPFAILALAIGVLYWPSVASLWARWQPDPSYSHGWLIVLISAWLVYREGQDGRLDNSRPSWLGVAVIPLLGATWLLAMAGSIGIVQWLLLPAFLFAAAFALYGWTALRRMWFPIGFILFAIPLWAGLTPFLQELTTDVVGRVLMAFRIPALLDGFRVHLPSGSFEIVESCSGAHFFIVSLTLAALYGWLWYGRLTTTLKLIAVALVVALIANWLRVFLVIYAGYVTEMQHFLVQVDHHYFGWVLYMVMLAPVLWLARRWEPATKPAAASGGGPHDAASEQPGAALGTSAAVALSRRLPAVGYTLIALAIAPLAWLILSGSATYAAPTALPAGQGGWTLAGSARSDWRPQYRGPDVELDGVYWRGEQGVDAWVVYFERPRHGSEVANQTNRLANRRDGWLQHLDSSGNFAEATLSGPAGERLIRYLHVVGGRESTALMTAKLHQIIGTLSGRPEAALLAISTPCRPDCAAARDMLAAFEADMGVALRTTIAGRGRGDEQARAGANSAHHGGRE